MPKPNLKISTCVDIDPDGDVALPLASHPTISSLDISSHSDIISDLLSDPVSASLSIAESEKRKSSHEEPADHTDSHQTCRENCVGSESDEDGVDIASLTHTAHHIHETERQFGIKTTLPNSNGAKQTLTDSASRLRDISALESLDSALNTGSWVFENNVMYAGPEAGEIPLRSPRGTKGAALSNFSRLSFWIVVCSVLLVTVPFLLCLLLILQSGDAYLNECHPKNTQSIVLVVVCGVIHFALLIAYISQVLRHRAHPALKVRGHFFLWQICILAPFIPIVCTLNSLEFMGVLSGDCIFTYGGIEGQTNMWSLGSEYVLVGTQAAIRFFSIMFFAAIIARQRTVYLIFVKHPDEFRTYSRRKLLKQYMYPNLLCLLVWFITEAVYQVCTYLVRADEESYESSAEFHAWISSIGVLERSLSTLAIVIVFSYYAYETRNVDVFSDWSANARTIALFSIGTIVAGVCKLITGATLWAGFLHGAMVMSLITIYFMDSFTAPLVDIHVGLNEQEWANRRNLNTTVKLTSRSVR